MIKLLNSGRTWVIASFALFAVMFMTGWSWWDQQSAQTREYLLGRLAYMSASYDLAVEYFDKSYSHYESTKSAKQDALTAPPSLEIAELSQHFKAMSLVKMGNGKLAVVTFKEALKLTTDEALSHVSLDPQILKKVKEDRRTTQIDLEILFNQKPQMAKQEGKGKGQKGEGDKQSEDPSASGNQSGKTDRDQL